MNDEANETRQSAPMAAAAKDAREIPAQDQRRSARLQCVHEICMQSLLPMAICFAQGSRLICNPAWSALLEMNPHASPSSADTLAQDIYGAQWTSIAAAVAEVTNAGESRQYGSQLFGNSHQGRNHGFFHYTLQPLALENEDCAVLMIAERSYEDVESQYNEFIAIMAHELRNPFSALASAAQLLNRAADRPQIMTAARDALSRQVNHLAQLLDDLLDISRLRRDSLKLRRQVLSLEEVVTAAVQSTGLIENKQLDLSAMKSDASLLLDGDRLLLIKAFSNLLKFLARHNGLNRPLQLNLTVHETQAVVTLDNLSIAPEMIQHVVVLCQEKPMRLPGRNIDLGFYLACGLLQVHGGQISARQNAGGDGTECVIRLPLVQANSNNMDQASAPT